MGDSGDGRNAFCHPTRNRVDLLPVCWVTYDERLCPKKRTYNLSEQSEAVARWGMKS
jgi:hypothetical protein